MPKNINKESWWIDTQIPVFTLSSASPSLKKKLLIISAAVFLSAFFLRIIFVSEVLQQNSFLHNDPNITSQANFLATDSSAYINLAKKILSGYFGPKADSDALLRPPGYPAFLAPFYSFGLSTKWILFSQAFLSAVIPVLTLMLAYMFTGGIGLASIAGFLSAFSPTGIGLCGVILSDTLFAVMMIVSLYCLCCGAAKAQGNLVLLSGVLFGAAFLVKPIMSFWPVCMIAVYYLLCRAAATKLNLRKLAVAFAIQIIIIGLWCTRNYVYEGVFTPSSVTVNNLHDCMRPRVEEWAKAGMMPTREAIQRNRDVASKKFMQQNPGLTSKEKMQVLTAGTMEIFKAYPETTAKVFLQNIKESTSAGWTYFYNQLPLSSLQELIILTKVTKIESVFKKYSLLAVILLFFCLCVSTILKNTDKHRNKIFAFAAGGITLSYFALLSGTTIGVGSRIMYPVEFILIVLFCMTLQQAVQSVAEIFLSAKKS
jgi:4-amino-4-deoxy-L-arabinose transferase-like glycosyltransferase